MLLAASGGPHRPGCVCVVRLCCLGLLVGGPGMGPVLADDNMGEVDVVCLMAVCISERRCLPQHLTGLVFL